MVAPLKEPKKFKKVYFRLTDSRVLGQYRKMSEINYWLSKLLQTLHIRSKVKEFSKIGKDIIELYVEEDDVSYVICKLEESRIRSIKHRNGDIPDWAVGGRRVEILNRCVNRLAHLYKNSKSRNMERCILEDLSEEHIKLVEDKVEELLEEEAKTETEGIGAPKSNKKIVPVKLIQKARQTINKTAVINKCR